jgi:hypothetical protein
MAVRGLAGAAVCFLISATFLFVQFCFVLRASTDFVHEDLDFLRRDTCSVEEQSFFPVYSASAFRLLDSALRLPVHRLRGIFPVPASSRVALYFPALAFRLDLRPSAYLADHAIPVSEDGHTFVVHLPVAGSPAEQSD